VLRKRANVKLCWQIKDGWQFALMFVGVLVFVGMMAWKLMHDIKNSGK
jgi:uncharacterized protein (UPF0333 family)